MKRVNTSKTSIQVSAAADVRLNSAREWMASYPADTELLLLANSTEAGNDLHLNSVASRGAAF